MKILLELDGIVFCITSERNLKSGEALARFEKPVGSADVNVTFSWDWDSATFPDGEPDGIDLLHHFYRRPGGLYCMTRGGPKGYTGGCVCSPDFRELRLYLNEKPFICLPDTLDALLRYLPLMTVFQAFGTLFFHASQVALGGTGIVFTAPSGTGKTTQANLWRETRGARLICNDRTLVRRRADGWRTYGYPVDGSAPVCSTEVNRLGAVVLLAQGPENRVERLTGAHAVAALMPQLVIDTWSADARAKSAEQLLELLSEIPAYRLVCTPDERAVRCLEQRLKHDRVKLN